MYQAQKDLLRNGYESTVRGTKVEMGFIAKYSCFVVEFR